jgi:hypothetical protein
MTEIVATNGFRGKWRSNASVLGVAEFAVQVQMPESLPSGESSTIVRYVLALAGSRNAQATPIGHKTDASGTTQNDGANPVFLSSIAPQFHPAISFCGLLCREGTAGESAIHPRRHSL